MRFFFDMDGTLSKWEWVGPDVYAAKGYFLNRPTIPNMVDAVKKLISSSTGPEIYILSSVLSDNHSIKEKNEWIDKIFGDSIPENRRLFVPYGEDKADFLKKKGFSLEKLDVLVDDYNPNLRGWEKLGGTGIKCLNGINGSSNEWDGYVIDIRSSSKIIANTIFGVYFCA